MAAQPLSSDELRHYTNLWCRQRGIHARDLESHPCADDLVLISLIEQEYQDCLTTLHRQQLGKIKHWLEKKLTLKASQVRQLEQMVLEAEELRETEQAKKALIQNIRRTQARQRLRSMLEKDQ